MAVVALVVVPGQASQAGTFELFGFGPRAMGMGGAMTAEADDFTAAFYNPALVAWGDQPKIGLGFTFMKPALSVRTQNPGKALDCARCDPLEMGGFDAGAVIPLGGKINNRLAIGFGAHVPTLGVTHVRAPDPSRPFWSRYFNEPDRLAVFASLGVRILDTLMIGAGAQVHGGLTGSGLQAEVDAINKQVRLREIDSYLSSDVGATAGIYFEPDPVLRFGASYRSSFSMGYAVPADMDLGVATMLMDIHGTIHFTPHTFSFGGAWDATDELTVAADASYELWAEAPSPYMWLSMDIDGELLESVGMQDALDIPGSMPPPNFVNTFNARIGAEYRFSESLMVRGGLFYRPTMVPNQDAPGQNILDSNAVGISAGLGFSVLDPLEMFEKPLHIDLGALAIVHSRRVAQKTEGDAIGSYEYGGTVFALSSSIRYDF